VKRGELLKARKKLARDDRLGSRTGSGSLFSRLSVSRLLVAVLVSHVLGQMVRTRKCVGTLVAVA
jgi:hypothetical protein